MKPGDTVELSYVKGIISDDQLKPSSPAVKTKKTTKLTKKMYTLAIEASTGKTSNVSRRHNITTGAVCQYLNKHPEIKELLSKKRMDNVSLAEDVLFEHLKKGTDQKVRQDSAKFITTRLGKKRGWTERTETEITGQINSDINLIKLCEELLDEDKIPKSNKESDKE